MVADSRRLRHAEPGARDDNEVVISKYIIYVTAALCLAADLITKSWASSNLTPGIKTPLIPGLLALMLTTNTGAAFGLGRNFGWFMSLVAFAVFGAVLLWVREREKSATKPPAYERIGMGFLIGGALGNIWDRVIAGRVTDFLDFSFISFPVFNLADVSIDIGVALILLRMLTQSRGYSALRSKQPVNVEEKSSRSEEYP